MEPMDDSMQSNPDRNYPDHGNANETNWEINSEFNGPDAAGRQMDRLVDGELSDADRKALLSGLDHEPEGWRRCALAFLEAQAWKQELRFIAKPQAAQDSRVESDEVLALKTATEGQVDRSLGWRQRLSTALAMAASFLVALVIGSQLHRGFGPGPAGTELVGANASGAGASHPTALVQPTTLPMGDKWELVTLKANDGKDGAQRIVRVPAVDRETLDAQMYQSLPETVPPDVLEAMTRMGHEVRQHRELVPVPLNDGRQMVVPVDRVELHYVGRPSL